MPRRTGTTIDDRSAIRIERDAMGEIAVPRDAYFGAQTQRALRYSSCRGGSFGSYPALVKAVALVKRAAAETNVELGVFDPEIGEAIARACDEVAAGELRDALVVDMLSPSDTSHNMNVNEVLANRANELLGGSLGEYTPVHPIDHVNRSQSTNDVMHTAVRLASRELGDALCSDLAALERSFRTKAAELGPIVKVGRTCLQDALPIGFAAVLDGYASAVSTSREGIVRDLDALCEVNLGGTAIGTGFNTPRGYIPVVLERLSLLTGLSLRSARSLVGATQNEEPIAFLSSRLRVAALSLSKIASDLRLMASGPRAGFGEIELPALQAGSSMMPGKVNPVVTLLVNHTAYLVSGYDAAIGQAVEGAELELNPHGSLIAYCLLESLRLVGGSVETLSASCIDGIKVRAQACEDAVGRSVSMVSALTPVLGYERAAEVARVALSENTSVADVVIDEHLLPPERAMELLSRGASGDARGSEERAVEHPATEGGRPA